ncbi:MAG TPA: hypothetical protein VIV60_16655 [Polyangiaceae bacterium]
MKAALPKSILSGRSGLQVGPLSVSGGYGVDGGTPRQGQKMPSRCVKRLWLWRKAHAVRKNWNVSPASVKPLTAKAESEQ